MGSRSNWKPEPSSNLSKATATASRSLRKRDDAVSNDFGRETLKPTAYTINLNVSTLNHDVLQLLHGPRMPGSPVLQPNAAVPAPGSAFDEPFHGLGFRVCGFRGLGFRV